MKTINESIIRNLVAESLRNILENSAFEYRTKGALGKKTLEKNAGKTAGEIMADRDAKAEEDKIGSQWEETADDILAKYEEEPEFDDTQASHGEYKIDKRNPYFYEKDGSEQSADAIGNFHNDFAIVKKDGKCNFINGDGYVISDEWFDACNEFESGFAMVSKNGKRNFIDDNGQYLLKTWVDRAGDFMGDTAPVIINGERHEVDRNGQIL